MNVSTWVKGKSQTLGNGNITVVEFWATWCGPCKVSIPHLTELAHKYKGKVNFVGVSVWERSPEDYKTKVPAFVKEYGTKMDYNVATEGPGTYMANNWMKASGSSGIPTAFIVDKQGKVAWIGHPMSGLGEALDQVISGKLDLAKARKARASENSQQDAQAKLQAEMGKKMAPIMKAMQAKKFQVASDEADKVIKSDPKLAPMAQQYKLVAMIQGNLKGLDSYISAVGNGSFGKNANALNQIIWMIVEKDLKLAPSAYKSAAKLGEKMMSLAPKDGMNMDTYALALWRAGDKAKALAMQKQAVALVKNDKRVDAKTMGEMKARIKQFGG